MNPPALRACQHVEDFLASPPESTDVVNEARLRVPALSVETDFSFRCSFINLLFHLRGLSSKPKKFLRKLCEIGSMMFYVL